MKIYFIAGSSTVIKFAFYDRDDHKIIENLASKARREENLFHFASWDSYNFHYDFYHFYDENLNKLETIHLTEALFKKKFSQENSLPDIFGIATENSLVVSERLKKFIESQKINESKFFSIDLFGIKYYYWFIMPSKTFLDIDLSIIDWDKDVSVYANNIEKYVFSQSAIGERSVFRLPFSGGLLGRYFITESFYENLMKQKMNLSVCFLTESNFEISR